MSLCFYIDHLQRFKVAFYLFMTFSRDEKNKEVRGTLEEIIKSLSAGQHWIAVNFKCLVQFVDSLSLQLLDIELWVL